MTAAGSECEGWKWEDLLKTNPHMCKTMWTLGEGGGGRGGRHVRALYPTASKRKGHDRDILRHLRPVHGTEVLNNLCLFIIIFLCYITIIFGHYSTDNNIILSGCMYAPNVWFCDEPTFSTKMRSQLNDTQSSQAHAHTQGRVMCQKYVLSTIFTLKPESTVFK